MESLIGLDIGTTNTKLVIAGRDGSMTWSTRKTYPSTQTPDGGHEQDPELILAAVKEVLAQGLKQVDSTDILFISISAAMHGMIPVDDAGKALSPMMTWADTRSNPIAVALKNTGAGRQLHRDTGTPVHPMSPLCKIAWLRQERPAVFAAAAKFISIKEYIWFHLFSEFVIDHSIASATGLFNIRTKQWNPASLEFAGITADRLSQPVPVGYSKIYDGVKYIIGASDGALANLGTGAIREGEVALTIGTSSAVRVINRKPIQDAAGRLFNYMVDDGYYLCGGAGNNGGIALRWFVESFYPGEQGGDLNRIIEEAASVPAGCEGLVFLPYVYGERAPVWDASAAGVFFGIRSRHNRAYFLRAVLEGICFALKQILQALEENGEMVNEILASGGFTASPVWLEILAGILGKPVRLTQDADASAMGAIFLAMKEEGLIDSFESIDGLLEKKEPFFPDPAYAGSYDRNYQVFTRLYGKLADEFDRG
ncbi:MAG: gluconate kinase [Chitinophagaceae bacterium]|nr:MAG: gluconate kinase [Chitinophagaceae bacterium]